MTGRAVSHEDVAEFMRGAAEHRLDARAGWGGCIEQKRDAATARVELVGGEGAVEDFPTKSISNFFTRVDLKKAESKAPTDGAAGAPHRRVRDQPELELRHLGPPWNEIIDKVLKAPPLQRWGGLAAVLVLLTIAQLLLRGPPGAGHPRGAGGAAAAAGHRSCRRSRRSPRTSTSAAARWTSSSRSWTRRSTELPEAADLDELLAQLNEIGRKSGLEISTVEPAPEESAQIYVEDPDQDGADRELPRDRHVPAVAREPAAHRQRQQHPARIAHAEAEKVVLKTVFVATTFRFLDPKTAEQDKKKALDAMSSRSLLARRAARLGGPRRRLRWRRDAPALAAHGQEGRRCQAAPRRREPAPGRAYVRLQPDRQAGPVPQPRGRARGAGDAGQHRLHRAAVPVRRGSAHAGGGGQRRRQPGGDGPGPRGPRLLRPPQHPGRDGRAGRSPRS